MQQSASVSSLEYLVDKYDLFILDLCGVLHDDRKVFPESLAAIEYIQNKEKQILFLSNSPRPSSHIQNFLEQQGLVLESKDKIVTSYDYFAFCVSRNERLKNKYYFQLGQNPNIRFIEGVYTTDILEDADYLIISLFKEENSGDIGSEWHDTLYRAKSLEIQGICINPDFVAPYGEIFRYTPGYFAHLYECIEGKVEYFGKPVSGIYEFALKSSTINKQKVLAIGDSLSTDIAGANAFGIDSVLVYDKGVHKAVNFKERENAEQVFETNKARPTYILPSLSLNKLNTYEPSL